MVENEHWQNGYVCKDEHDEGIEIFAPAPLAHNLLRNVAEDESIGNANHVGGNHYAEEDVQLFALG